MSAKSTPNTDILEKSELESLKQLAEELAYNYFSSSFGDDDKATIHFKELFKEKAGERFSERFNSGERIRNILIVGAGASYDVFKAIPLAKSLVEEVRDEFETEIKTIPFLKKKFEQEVNEIKDITGKPDLNFENYLYLLSRFFVRQKDLRSKIEEMTGFKYAISLLNEIIAHLLKHSFLDVVINFNFEETLDQAIEEEIGRKNYYHVISDGHCVGLENILVDGRLKMPVYIKPHGTCSHKSTMRFTNRHYFDLPNDIRVMLFDLLRGKRGAKKKEVQKVNLICIGFALESFEFNKILNQALPPKSVIYHIDYNPFDDKKADLFFSETLSVFTGRAKKIGRGVRKNVSPNESEILYKPVRTAGFSQNNQGPDQSGNPNKLTSTFSEIFSVLWRFQYDVFNEAYRPRSIARHEIIAYLFYSPSFGIKDRPVSLPERVAERKLMKATIEQHPKYFRDRTLVEIAISISRGNGMVDIIELLRGRVGVYFKKFLETAEASTAKIRAKDTIYELLRQFVDKKGDGQQPISCQTRFQQANLFILPACFTAADAIDMKVEELINAVSSNFYGLELKDYHRITYEELNALGAGFIEKLKLIFTSRIDNLRTQESFLTSISWVQLDRTIMILSKLFSCRLLSNDFKVNFLKNHDEAVHNGKVLNEEGENSMAEELFRLFEKSVGMHYFVINSAPKDPAHFMWESFEKKKLIHTNLALTYEFNNLFLRSDWDILLTITETGSSLNFLQYLEGDEKSECQKKCASRHFIVICCDEAVQQLYPYIKTKQELVLHHRAILSAGVLNEQNLSVLLVPFNLHNHHAVQFLKAEELNFQDINEKFTVFSKLNTKTKVTSYSFVGVGSIYMHRQGMSNTIDPLFVGTDYNELNDPYKYNDQQRLLKLFVIHLLRGFKYQREREKGHSWAKQDYLEKLLEFYTDLAGKAYLYSRMEDIMLNKFLSLLYKALCPGQREE